MTSRATSTSGCSPQMHAVACKWDRPLRNKACGDEELMETRLVCAGDMTAFSADWEIQKSDTLMIVSQEELKLKNRWSGQRKCVRDSGELFWGKAVEGCVKNCWKWPPPVFRKTILISLHGIVSIMAGRVTRQDELRHWVSMTRLTKHFLVNKSFSSNELISHSLQGSSNSKQANFPWWYHLCLISRN